MLLSKACEYGIQVVLHLAVEGRENYVPVRELAEKAHIPFHFLGKICGMLTQNGILHSYKGPNGGVVLARPMTEITLLEVVYAIDGPNVFEGCVLGLEPCSAELPCPVHREWAEIKRMILEMLSGKTLQEIADELTEGSVSLKQMFQRRTRMLPRASGEER